MKKVLFGLGLMGTVALSSVAHAFTYAVVDMDLVAEKNTYLTQQNQVIEKNKETVSARLKQIEGELKNLEATAASPQAANMKEADRQKLQSQYTAKQTEAQNAVANLQKSIQQTTVNAHSVWTKRVAQAGEQLRREHKVDVILDKKTVVSFDPKYDLTDKMTQLVNAIK